MLPQNLKKAIEAEAKSTVAEVQWCGGGSINHAAVLTLSDGRQWFLKYNETAPAGFFAAEAAGLSAMAETQTVRVPKVVCFRERDEAAPAFLVLDYLAPGKKTAAAEAAAGCALAKMHRASSELFGWPQDNFIGLTPQRNGWQQSWSTFFLRNRLMMQAEFGVRSGWLSTGLERLLREKTRRIVELLDECGCAPSLLHGDLWGGNVYYAAEGPVFIDPAVYFGNREADLAFTEMFGGFGADFYRAYHAEWPLDSGYELRKRVYNLYHEMNHANLFGGHYVDAVRVTLEGL